MKKRRALLIEAYQKLKRSKGRKIFSDQQSYYYKNICVEKKDNVIEMYDTSTDIYRPLMLQELIAFVSMEIDEFTQMLAFRNTLQAFNNNKKLFHIAILKNKEKEKIYYYKKAKRRLNNLRKLLDINKNLTKFVNY